ncbi:MAG: antibiotic biosynthesis monooxygenase [Dehalococcoidales bacterium]|nr:MAG: antibiotic biosynthesis monooxygenase [Dehalococcoidales bacterium]
MSPEDIAAIAYLTPKPGREEHCIKLAKEMMQSTWAEDEGCICYYFYQRQDNPNEWVFHERWKDWDSANAHLQRLSRVYGPADENLPWCPAAIREPWEKFEFVGLTPVA